MTKNQKTTTLTILLTILLTTQITTAITISGQGSSYTFTIENCTSPQINTTINCNPTTIRFQCDIYNPAFINQVEYRIQGTNYITTQNSTNPKQFYYNYQKPLETETNQEPIIFDRQRITDTNNKQINAYEYVEIPHNCTTCPANLTRTPLETCQPNNTQQIQYTSTNETCTPSYNTTENCNYCNPELIIEYTECDKETQTQNYTYKDLNLNTCCLITELQEDCPTYYPPYNQIYTQNCQYLKKEFNCSLDKKPTLNKKINIICTLPTNEEHCCIINTYKNENLLATSPEYKKPSTSILTITQEEEIRQCFTTQNALLNAYYTNKELRPYNNYTIEIICTNTEGQKLTYQEQITPEYHTSDWLIYRIKWLGEYPITILLTTTIIITIIIIAIKTIKKI